MNTAAELVTELNVILMREDLSGREINVINEAIDRITSFGDEVWVSGESVYRNAKCIDVALNGERGALQPALCDVTSQIEHIRRNVGAPLSLALGHPEDFFAIQFATRDEHGVVTLHGRARKDFPEWVVDFYRQCGMWG